MSVSRTYPTCNKSVIVDPSFSSVTVVPANTSTQVAPAAQTSYSYSRCWITNISPVNTVYYALGETCTPTNNHGILDSISQAGQGIQELTPYVGPISCYCPTTGGAIVSVCRLIDLSDAAPGQGGILITNNPAGTGS